MLRNVGVEHEALVKTYVTRGWANLGVRQSTSRGIIKTKWLDTDSLRPQVHRYIGDIKTWMTTLDTTDGQSRTALGSGLP